MCKNLPGRGEICRGIGGFSQNFGGRNANVKGPGGFVNGLLILKGVLASQKFLRPETQMLNVKMLILAAPIWARISPDEAKLAEKSADFRRISGAATQMLMAPVGLLTLC